jgi:hypothetical protein
MEPLKYLRFYISHERNVDCVVNRNLALKLNCRSLRRRRNQVLCVIAILRLPILYTLKADKSNEK